VVSEEKLEVWVEYEVGREKAWVEVWGADKVKDKRKLKELEEILGSYGFEAWDMYDWDADIDRDRVEDLVEELKMRGFDVRYYKKRD
jgi:hypothetical protein